MNIKWQVLCVPIWIGVCAFFSTLLAQEHKPAYEDSTYKHDPYDLNKMAQVDSTDVYATKVNHLFRLPQYTWGALAHPFGQLTIYAERTKLWVQYFDLFTNQAGTFGVFPVVQIGGDTGHGGGARVFHTNLFDKQKEISGQFVYSGPKGQFGEGFYRHPNFGRADLTWKLEGRYLQTRHVGANINTAVENSKPPRLFEVKQIDVKSAWRWEHRQGPMSGFVPRVEVVGWGGYGWRDFRAVIGGGQPLTHAGSSDQARLLKGLGSAYGFYRVGGKLVIDRRDYKQPVATLSHPIVYRFPGRIVKLFGDLYYHYRDVGYPEQGELFLAEGDWVSGADRVKFYRVNIEAAKYMTLFWKNRILVIRGHLEKVTPWGGGFVPYTELVQMGGNETMRGYKRGYFRGQGAIQLNVEYRYPIWDTWNAFLFWDEGQIFDRYADLTWGDFHSSWGGGIAFRTEKDVLGKIKIGHSAVEKVLVGFSLEQAF